MNNKKKTVVPKKKAIKKPKYIKYFALWLAIFLVISMTASYFIFSETSLVLSTKTLTL